ncbi:hypothetical protein HDU96_005084, partial [Phlyctochytrium bullatum]
MANRTAPGSQGFSSSSATNNPAAKKPAGGLPPMRHIPYALQSDGSLKLFDLKEQGSTPKMARQASQTNPMTPFVPEPKASDTTAQPAKRNLPASFPNSSSSSSLGSHRQRLYSTFDGTTKSSATLDLTKPNTPAAAPAGGAMQWSIEQLEVLDQVVNFRKN